MDASFSLIDSPRKIWHVLLLYVLVLLLVHVELSVATIVDVFGTDYNSSLSTFISVSGSSVTGTIPSRIGLLSKLGTIQISHSSVTGTIPLELGELSRLGVLQITNNSGINGPIPNTLDGGMENLATLALTGNALSQSIPTNIGQLPAVGYLDVSNNQLTGTMPSQLGELSTLVTLLAVNDNAELSGNIPSQLGTLSLLQNLHLQNTKLTGQMPREVLELSQLTTNTDNTLIFDNPTASPTVSPQTGSPTESPQVGSHAARTNRDGISVFQSSLIAAVVLATLM
mmetsp:Transcript_8351/g.10888  ORF Transcript_8351/g.10888 Transcript_8351/m.10888 type:complete len:284 (+) Transcript_8351:100-951(+)|eukprot:CAMPEP_0204873756 /NCGR_PEP_ID=MMETSP1348-20121228/41498_1 /ASSEMBLY_ACC=CAM_ASM_000700 /TAXON_ID=215587 /ORGANISM="Aplanochytrium stocchinoi, Strain GSBS06" /LENGTH=283 /DNA_ID=CAMNT_0052029243 /DNA_START=96 /DNA_END=947 /DNA_ORIENTATION=-